MSKNGFVSEWTPRLRALSTLPVIQIAFLLASPACGPAHEPPTAAPRLLTTAVGVEDYPAWSPDGQTLAYAASERGDVFGGNWDVWALDLATDTATNLTSDHGGDDRFPVWSPDGESIAFWSDRDGGGYFIVSRTDNSLRRVETSETSTSVASSAPAWSRDGRTLACVGRDASGVVLEFVDLTTGDRRSVPLPGKNTRRFDLAWSRDQRFVAYIDASSLTASVSQIYVLDLVTEAEVRVTDGSTNDASPSWAPDGSTLYYVSNRGGRRDVWGQPFASGQPAGTPTRVTEDVGVRHASLSPDGTTLVYSQGQTIANVWRVPILPDRPAVWNDAERLTSSDGFIEYIDLSVDGTRVLLSSDQSGNPDVWILNLGDRSLKQLTEDPGPQWGAVWSPDDATVALYDYRSGNRDLSVMPASGGPIRAIQPHPAEDYYPAWSPDGATLAFYSVRSGNRDVWIMQAEGGRVRQVTTHLGDDLFPQWSVDGQSLAFFSDRAGEGRLWRVSPNGGSPEPLTSGPARFGRWAPDGEWLYFTGWETRLGNLFGLSLRDGGERAVTDLAGKPGSLGSYALAVGDRHLYFTWEENVGDLWTTPVERGD